MRNVAPSTETEAIDAFLFEVGEEVSNLSSQRGIARLIASMAAAHLAERPNDAAFRDIADRVQTAARASVRQGSPDALRVETETIVSERTRLSDLFRSIGRRLISSPRRILVYSHSVRVTQALLGVDPHVQAATDLYIAECRPKSLHAFEDAYRTAGSLAEAKYRPTLIPDAMCFGLVTDHAVDMVLVGAHAIYVADDLPIAFVNTVGTAPLVRLAHHAASPVDVMVLAETAKTVDVSESNELPEISRGSEIPLSWQQSVTQPLPPGTRWVNLGYEQCPFLTNTTHIREDHGRPGR